jgi:PPE-repeat protein
VGKGAVDEDSIVAEFAALPGLMAKGLGETLLASTVSGARAGSGAKSIGPMSVPASWATPAVSQVSALSGTGLTTLPGTEEAVGAGMPGVPGMPAGTLTRASGVIPRYGTRLTVLPRPPAAG